MESSEIDDSLYSRQRYMLGDNAMLRLAQSNILVCSLNGLGVEIAKNVILAGAKSVTIQDWQPTTYCDLGSQFFLTEDDVKENKNRAVGSCKKLAELNPYVNVVCKTDCLDMTTDLTCLSAYQCVVLTSQSLELNLKVNDFCRTHNPPIKFICGDVYGVCCSAFCDFGDSFEIHDKDGEEPKEIFVASITQGQPGVVSTFDRRPHGLESGSHITLKEVTGMTEVNGKIFEIQVTSPYQFAIGDTSAFTSYVDGGIVTQVKVPATVKFQSLREQLVQPAVLTTDFSKMSAPLNIHLGYLTMNKFRETAGRLPALWSPNDAEQFLNLAKEINTNQLNELVNEVDEKLLKLMACTCQGQLPPLCAFLGGVLAQEVLKSVTGKFTPLQQWIHVDAVELLTGLDELPAEAFQPRNDRYDCLRMCISEPVCQKLHNLKLFMVGCGAIGCEMMKNYALLGIGTNGQITITDNDLIEKSNLNRQFLFRPYHIRKPKSTTAAKAVTDINRHMKIEAHQHKVCPETELSVYNNSFFEKQDIVVNALDNLEARRYMDHRCVTNQRPLLESGTMGAKGHVQVIVPHVTESYSSQRDPEEEDIPYCTLKSFPAVIEHCIQWARDKFESSFSQKPAMFNKFFVEQPDLKRVAQELRQGQSVDGAVPCSKMLAMCPASFQDCIKIARLKFEKYYNHRAKQLLHAFPQDTRLKDGSLFWASPKRPPVPVEFDSRKELHMKFIMACARLYADIYGIKSPSNVSHAELEQVLSTVSVPQFTPTTKRIETDESAKKPQEDETSGDSMQQAFNMFNSISNGVPQMHALSFEKDEDSNGHIDFIYTASNLRADMYNIENADRLKTKKIAGRIVPAIATTTAAVAGLVTLELLKLLKERSLEDFKNCFLNLALPVVLFSEPGAASKTAMSNGTQYTQWDRWEISSDGVDVKLNQFIALVKSKFGLDVSMVVQGSRMVYVPMMPAHKKRLTQPMSKLIKKVPGVNYVDLHVSYTKPDFGQGEDEDQMGPPLRYFF